MALKGPVVEVKKVIRERRLLTSVDLPPMVEDVNPRVRGRRENERCRSYAEGTEPLGEILGVYPENLQALP
jgi:hypothetical protein